MKQIRFATTSDNRIPHRQIKQLMMQRHILDIRVDDAFALISCRAVTGIQYILNPESWNWILNYLQTGDYEDFGVSPSAVFRPVFLTDGLKQLIAQGCNIARVPFLRETEAYIKLRALFRYGKLFFSIRRNEEFMDYLTDNGL